MSRSGEKPYHKVLEILIPNSWKKVPGNNRRFLSSISQPSAMGHVKQEGLYQFDILATWYIPSMTAEVGLGY